MFKKRLRRHLAWAAMAAFGAALVVDLFIGWNGGFSYAYGLFGRFQDGPSSLTGLRDGLLGNLLFFLCAGITVTITTAHDPRSQPFVHRLTAMFPHLEEHLGLIEPIVSLVKEDASVTIESVTTIRLVEYDAAGGAYRIEVVKEERIASLLANEPYLDADFQIRVSADDVAGHPVLGSVEQATVVAVASMTHPELATASRVAPTDFLEGKTVDLSPDKLSWGVEDKSVELPVGMDGLITLRYWVYAAITEPFTSVIRRPARKVTVRLESRLPTTTGGAVHVRLHIKGETTRSKVFVRRLNPGRNSVHEVSFNPRRRRPVLQLDFGAPGVILAPVIQST